MCWAHSSERGPLYRERSFQMHITITYNIAEQMKIVQFPKTNYNLTFQGKNLVSDLAFSYKHNWAEFWGFFLKCAFNDE